MNRSVRTIGVAWMALGLLVAGCAPPAAGDADSIESDWTKDAENPSRRCRTYGPRDTRVCEDAVPRIGPDAATLRRTYEGLAQRYPIVLAHGFNTTAGGAWSMTGVAEVLREQGFQVLEASLSPYATSSVRMRELGGAVDAALAKFGAERVHIVGHSLGGLDARRLSYEPDAASRIFSITTIAAPHQGTPVADSVLSTIHEGGSATVEVLDSVAGLFDRRPGQVNAADLVGVLGDLSVANAPAFNEAFPKRGEIFEQSWATVSEPLGGPIEAKHEQACGHMLARTAKSTMDLSHVLLWSLTPFAAEPDGSATDGLVPTGSARFGDAFRGCVPADHLESIGWGGDGYGTGFSFSRFYLSMAYELASLEGCAPDAIVCERTNELGAWPSRCACR